MTAETWTQADMQAYNRGEVVPVRKPKRPAPDTLTITLPLPSPNCSPNARCHWSATRRSNTKMREASHLAARIELREINTDPPRWKQATVEATFYKPAKQAKRTDADNAIASLKGAFDGLQDAGLIANDAGLTHLPPKQLIGAEAGGERKVVLVIRHVA